MATVGLIVASPAFGGPPVFDLALRAFEDSQEATVKAERAGHRARVARRLASRANHRIRRARRANARVGRSLRTRVQTLEARATLGAGANAIAGRSAFSSEVCRNDQTAPWEEQADAFLQCGDSVTIEVSREHRLLVNISLGWFTDAAGSGECTILDGGQPSGPVIRSGERSNTTYTDVPNSASLTSVLPPRSGESVLAVGCRERMADIDWTDIAISAVAIGAD